MKCKRCNGTGVEADAEDIKDSRERAQLTQQQAAKRMGISASYLSDLENGRRDWDSDLLEKFYAMLSKHNMTHLRAKNGRGS